MQGFPVGFKCSHDSFDHGAPVFRVAHGARLVRVGSACHRLAAVVIVSTCSQQDRNYRGLLGAAFRRPARAPRRSIRSHPASSCSAPVQTGRNCPAEQAEVVHAHRKHDTTTYLMPTKFPLHSARRHTSAIPVSALDTFSTRRLLVLTLGTDVAWSTDYSFAMVFWFGIVQGFPVRFMLA